MQRHAIIEGQNPAPTLRVGSIATIVTVLRDVGVDADHALARVGLSATVFENPEAIIPYKAYDQLLEIGAQESDCEHIGLLVGMTRCDIGLPGYIMLNAPTVQIGLDDAIYFQHMTDQGGAFRLSQTNDLATLHYSLYAPNMRCVDHICDTAMAIAYGALRRMIGPRFEGTEIRLPRRAPANIGPYRGFYSRERIHFDAHEAAIDFPARYLDQPIEQADPTLYRFLKRTFARGPKVGASMAEQIRRILPDLIRHKAVNGRVIAEVFGTHPRTMARRLAEEDITLQSLVDDARFEVARQLLRDTDMTLTGIATTLYYADASAFTRAFKRKFSVPPGAWRRQRGVNAPEAETSM